MPWVPKTDFEEEVVNLQPDHDFIFGFLSEPQYPRPTSHTEYAASKKLQDKEQQKEFEATGKINSRLRVIQQVQRIASTKPVGEQPTLDDWESNEKLEQETIGLMRHYGMGSNVEQPLNENATYASYPVEKTNKVVTNGRRKVALFFDDNVFKMKEKVSDTSSGFESCNNSDSNNIIINKNDLLASELEGDTSFSTSSSFSFSTAGECDDSFSSAAATCLKSPSKRISKQRFSQYDKLIEDTSLLSLNSSRESKSSQKQRSDSFRTADESFSWTPVFEDDEDLFCKKEDWPVLSKNKILSDINSADNNDIFNKTQSDLVDDTCSEASSTLPKRENFLDRFIKPDKNDNTIDTTADSTSTTSSLEPDSYASIAKTPKSPKKKERKSPDFITHFPPFYTTRKMYALKRNPK